MMFNGISIPDDMCVLHKCDNPPCVNPDHLFIGDRSDNSADRDRKGRLGKKHGEFNGRSLLCDEDVRRIKDMIACGAMQTRIAEWFSVHPCTISDIKHGRRWTHVD